MLEDKILGKCTLILLMSGFHFTELLHLQTFTFLAVLLLRVNVLTCFDMLFVSAEPNPSNVEWHGQKTVRVLFHDRRHQQLCVTQQRYLVPLQTFPLMIPQYTGLHLRCHDYYKRQFFTKASIFSWILVIITFYLEKEKFGVSKSFYFDR